MNWWEILKISQDSDLKTIKKAYAKLLKIYNPEEDPEGYQRLREAYDKAIKNVKKNNNRQENLHVNLVENISDEVSRIKNNINEYETTYENINYEEQNNYYDNDINNSNKTFLSYDNVEQENHNNDINLQIEEIIDKLNEIYNDNSLRKDSKVWEELLNRDVIWNVYSSPIIEEYIFEFLLNHKDLTLNIWCILDHYFNWTKKERIMYEKYGKETVEEVFKTLQSINQIKYEYINQINPDFIEKYLSLRNQAYEVLKKRDYYEAQECLLSAYGIFKYDAELLKLIGEFYYKIGDLDKSLDFFKQAFEIDKVDLKAALYIGHILGKKCCYVEALPYLELYMSSNNDDEMALNNIGFCYYFTGSFLKAKESFKRLLKFQPKNRTAKKYLKNIEAKLDDKNVKTLKLKEYKPRKKKIVKKKEKKQKTEASMKKGRIKAIIILLIATSIVLKFTFIDKIPVNNKTEKITEEQDKIDSSTEEVERLKKQNESIETHDDKRIKTVKTIQQFNESEYDALHSIYLKNIIPLNMYVNVDEKGKFDFRKKEELNEINSKDKTYTKAYVGEIDGKNVLFIDSKFSMDKADSNGGYTVEGYKYKFTVTGEINLPAENGQNVTLVRVEQCFIYSTNLKVGP